MLLALRDTALKHWNYDQYFDGFLDRPSYHGLAKIWMIWKFGKSTIPKHPSPEENQNTGDSGPDSEEIRNLQQAQTQVIQKSEDYSSDELGRMVSYLL